MARYALVIGISEYKSKHLANLRKPDGDAEAIATLLQKYGQCDRAPTVLRGRVTTHQLAVALQTFLTRQAVNSEAIIYFTGHDFSVKEPLGLSQRYLATSDCELFRPDGNGQVGGQYNAISFADLDNLIQSANLSSLTMFLDATPDSGGLLRDSQGGQCFSAFHVKGDHFLLAACRPFEAPQAKKSDKHSLFTDALLRSLSPENADADGKVTIDNVFAYVRQALKGTPQEPVRFGHGRSLPVVQFPSTELRNKTTVMQNNQQEHTKQTDDLLAIYRQQNLDLTELLKLATGRPIDAPKYDMRGAQFSGGFAEVVQGDQVGGTINNQAAETLSLEEATAEIQGLLKPLEATNPTATEAEQTAFLNIMIPPAQRERFIGALTAADSDAVEEVLYGGVLKVLVEGWQKPEG